MDIVESLIVFEKVTNMVNHFEWGVTSKICVCLAGLLIIVGFLFGMKYKKLGYAMFMFVLATIMVFPILIFGYRHTTVETYEKKTLLENELEVIYKDNRYVLLENNGDVIVFYLDSAD